MSAGDVAVVVLSCGAAPYSHCWQPCADLLNKFWPDRPWPLVLATDRYRGEVTGYDRILETGADQKSWGRNASAAMRMLKERRVLLLLDDFWATGPWDQAMLDRCLGWMEGKDAWYFRVAPTPGPDVITDPNYGICSPGARYRTSLQPAFWEAEYLARIAHPVDDPWSFELHHNGEPRALHLSVTVSNRPLSYTEALKRGKWRDEAIELAEREVAWRRPR